MQLYEIYCLNGKDRVVYKFHVRMKPKEFDEQVKSGYLRFRDEDDPNYEIICYLNMYNKVIIEKR